MTHAAYFGIDVSKAHLDLADEQRFIERFDNTKAGIRQLARYLKKAGATDVALEATGRYHQLVARRLHDAHFRVFVAAPSRVRAFARSQGRLAKNDQVDGILIARFAKLSEGLRCYQPPSESTERLRALALRRDQLVEDCAREKTRIEATELPEIQAMIRKSVAEKGKEIKDLEARIAQALASLPDTLALYRHLQQAKGVGPVTALTLVTQLPELGQVNRQEIASLAGLAPYDRDSGSHRGKRHIYGGRSRVRTALYVAAVSAKTHEKQFLKPLFQRLIERGKVKKAAIIAVARKLLVHLNTLAASFVADQKAAT